MAVPQATLQIYQGAVFTVTIPAPTGVLDVTAWGARMQLRSAPVDQSGVLSLTLTTGGGGIVVDAGKTSWTVTITPTQSNAMTLLSGVWDFYGDPDGVPDNATVICEFGTWTMRPEVTATTVVPAPPSIVAIAGDLLIYNGTQWVVAPTDVANVAALALQHGFEGQQIFVTTLLAPWTYVASGASLTVDHITVEATADGGNTRWVRDLDYLSPVWAAQAAWYIDPVAGSDEATGADVSHPIKTLAEWNRRTGTPWVVTANRDIYFASYPPVTDPLRLRVKFYQSTSGAGPVLTFHPPAFVTSSTGTFSAVTPHVQGSNVPWMVTDGVVVTTGDVKKRIRITSGARAGLRTWVAKSTGAGQRRTGTWLNSSFNATPTTGTPQVGDPYVIESGAGFLYLDEFYVDWSSTSVYPNSASIVMTGFDLAPTVTNSTVAIVNNGASVWLTDVGLWNGEWSVRTGDLHGDSAACFTVLQNCGAFSGQNNVFFMDGTFVDNFVWGGVFGGAVGPRNAAGVVVDYDVLAQGGLGGVPGLFTQSQGLLAIASAGVMDSGTSVFVGDGVAGLNIGVSLSGNLGLWGSGTSGVGVQVNAGGTFRYSSGTNLTITSIGGDFSLAGSTSARAWDDVGGAYTANISCTWANLVGGSLKDNAHSLTQNAHAYKNTGAAQP